MNYEFKQGVVCIFKIGFLGIMATILAVFIKKERAELSLFISITACGLIFFYIISQIELVLSFLSKLLHMISIEESYYIQLLKMLGVAYIAEFSSSLCKDAGYQSIAGMVELFAKLSILALSIPGLLFLIETLEAFI